MPALFRIKFYFLLLIRKQTPVIFKFDSFDRLRKRSTKKMFVTLLIAPWLYGCVHLDVGKIIRYPVLRLRCYVEYDSWINIELHHSLDANDPNNFSYRGNSTINSLNSGSAVIAQEVLSDHQRTNLKILAQQNGFYRLQATVTYSTGRKQSFLSSTRACSLLLAQLTDVLWVSIDSTGHVNGVTLTTSGSEKCSNLYLSTSGLEDFNTDIIVRHSELAPVPDTASFIQKLEREREARERGEVRDNRGFFAKYWMYIVPVVLLLFISGATNQDAAK